MIKGNQARNRVIALTDHVTTLRVVIGVLLIIVIAQWWRNGALQETRRLYIPPDLSQGLVTDLNQVPVPTVYTFAYYIFQQLYRWRQDGEQDFPKQIYALQGFLTPTCVAALKEEMNQKQRLGELRQRVRNVQEIYGHTFSPQRVLSETGNTWKVWLDVNVQEAINGHPVKDVMLRYSVRVVRFDVDREVNPWGLALACDEGMQPTLLQDEEIAKPFRRPGVGQ